MKLFRSLSLTRRLLCTVTIAGLVATSALAKDSEKELEAKAKVTRAEAEKTALAKVPGGKIKSAELEEEKGNLIWSFDVRIPDSKNLKEIHVDAISGKVIAEETETPKHEKEEEKSEKAEKKHKKHKEDEEKEHGEKK